MLGLDYEIHYKKGKENLVADALSRRGYEDDEGDREGAVNTISVAKPSWLMEAIDSYKGDEKATELLRALAMQPDSYSDYSLKGGILRYKGRIYIGAVGELRKKLIACFHESPIGGHSGNLGTYHRLKEHFFWPGMKKDTEEWV